MSVFPFFRKRQKTAGRRAGDESRGSPPHNRPEFDGTENLPFSENVTIFNNTPHYGDAYLYNAWVNIAVNVLIRNVARADFVIKKGGNDVTSGPLYELFRRPNPGVSRFDLWKETAAWWHIEGEAVQPKVALVVWP